MLNHPQKLWNWLLLARNLDIKSEDLSNSKWNDQLWRPIGLSDNKKLSMNFIETYCDDTWSFWSLSNNPKIRVSFILANRYKKWNWQAISKYNKYIMRLVKTNVMKELKISWDWVGISSNPHVSVGFIKKHFSKLSLHRLTHNGFQFQKLLTLRILLLQITTDHLPIELSKMINEYL